MFKLSGSGREEGSAVRDTHIISQDAVRVQTLDNTREKSIALVVKFQSSSEVVLKYCEEKISQEQRSRSTPREDRDRYRNS